MARLALRAAVAMLALAMYLGSLQGYYVDVAFVEVRSTFGDLEIRPLYASASSPDLNCTIFTQVKWDEVLISVTSTGNETSLCSFTAYITVENFGTVSAVPSLPQGDWVCVYGCGTCLTPGSTVIIVVRGAVPPNSSESIKVLEGFCKR